MLSAAALILAGVELWAVYREWQSVPGQIAQAFVGPQHALEAIGLAVMAFMLAALFSWWSFRAFRMARRARQQG